MDRIGKIGRSGTRGSIRRILVVDNDDFRLQELLGGQSLSH